MEVKVYPAGVPKEGQWVVQWITGYMPAPSFLYYETEAEARESAKRFIERRGEHGGKDL